MTDLLATYGNLINFLGINALLGLSIYATLATGQLSLGNAAFMGIGAYTAALLGMRLGMPFVLTLGLGGLAVASPPYSSDFPFCDLAVCSWQSPPSDSVRSSGLWP